MKDNIIEKVKEEITFENVLATAMKAPGVKDGNQRRNSYDKADIC